MRRIKKVARFIVEILLSISLTLCIILQVLSITILDENYVISTLNKTNYCIEIYEQANDGFENYIYQSGLDKSVINGIISEEKVKNDTVKIISNIYNGEQNEIAKEDIKRELEGNIKKFLGERKLTEAEQKAVDIFVETICEEYETNILHTKYETNVYSVLSKIIKYTNSIKKVLIVATIILIILLFALSKNHKYRFCSDTGVGLLAASILLIVVNLYVNISLDIKHIVILNEAFSRVIVYIIQEFFELIMQYGLIFGSIGLGLIIIPTLFHNKNKYR